MYSAIIAGLTLCSVITFLQVALVEEGFASVHVSAEKSEFFKQLKTAEDNAKQRKLKIWENYEEKSDDQVVEDEHVVSCL